MTQQQLPTDDQITALRNEALAAGDTEMAVIATSALDGYTGALAECASVIDDAAAQEDDCDPPPTWTVYHGGSLDGMGRWSGPHASCAEAKREAQRCRMTVGGAPTIRRD